MKKLLLLLFYFSFLSINNLVAGGFQINLQGQKQSGMGHTGTGLCTDNAAIFFNPGAMSFLDSARGIVFGASFIFPRVTYIEPYPGRYTANIEKNVGTPITLYAVYKFKKTQNWNIGLGIYNPFGSKVQWKDDWKGQFLIREIDLKTFFIQPTISYKVNEHLGLGIGFVYATGSFALRKAVPIQDSLGNYGEGKLNGKASGYGFNLGIYYKVNEKLSFGLDYRSEVKVNVDGGSAEFTVASGVQQYFPTTTFNTSIRLPYTTTFGIGYKVNQKLSFALDVNYVGWSSYDSLIIDFGKNTDKLKDIHSAREYQNAFIFRLGASYKLSDRWTTRIGTYYDMTPVKAGYLTPETPDANKIAGTIGITYKVTKRMNFDASMLYIEGMKRTDTNIETQFSGTYKSKSVVAGIGLSYIF